MKAIDTPALIQRVQEARARLGVTIRECAEKIGQPPYSTRISPEAWARFEKGEAPAQPAFTIQVAAMLGLEVPMIEVPEFSTKSYRCAPLSDEDRTELERLTDQVSSFCKAKGVGLLLLTSSNMTRTKIEDGHSEESLSTLQTANLFALPSPMAPLAHVLLTMAKDPEPMGLKESLRQVAGYTLALNEQTKESMEQVPAGNPVLEGFNESRPLFRGE